MLTAVAGGSSVAAVGAVAVEGAPSLDAFASMFTMAGGTPGERQKERVHLEFYQNVSFSCFYKPILAASTSVY